MANYEHPKSAVYRLISQKFNQNMNRIDGKTPNVIIHEPKFSHEYQQQGNKNIFKCSIVVSYDTQNISFVSDGYLNKKDSEYYVFQKIFDFLTTNLNSNTNTKINSTFNFKTDNMEKFDVDLKVPIFNLIKEDHDMSNTIIVIVDFENISRLDEIAHLYNVVVPGKAIYIVKVAGFCSSVKQNSDIVVRSNRKDAVDHYISYLIGLLESKNTFPIIYIISRDKFGSCLQDFCNNVTHCSDVADFLNNI